MCFGYCLRPQWHLPLSFPRVQKRRWPERDVLCHRHRGWDGEKAECGGRFPRCEDLEEQQAQHGRNPGKHQPCRVAANSQGARGCLVVLQLHFQSRAHKTVQTCHRSEERLTDTVSKCKSAPWEDRLSILHYLSCSGCMLSTESILRQQNAL